MILTHKNMDKLNLYRAMLALATEGSDPEAAEPEQEGVEEPVSEEVAPDQPSTFTPDKPTENVFQTPAAKLRDQLKELYARKVDRDIKIKKLLAGTAGRISELEQLDRQQLPEALSQYIKDQDAQRTAYNLFKERDSLLNKIYEIEQILSRSSGENISHEMYEVTPEKEYAIYDPWDAPSGEATQKDESGPLISRYKGQPQIPQLRMVSEALIVGEPKIEQESTSPSQPRILAFPLKAKPGSSWPTFPYLLVHEMGKGDRMRIVDLQLKDKKGGVRPLSSFLSAFMKESPEEKPEKEEGEEKVKQRPYTPEVARLMRAPIELSEGNIWNKFNKGDESAAVRKYIDVAPTQQTVQTLQGKDAAEHIKLGPDTTIVRQLKEKALDAGIPEVDSAQELERMIPEIRKTQGDHQAHVAESLLKQWRAAESFDPSQLTLDELIWQRSVAPVVSKIDDPRFTPDLWQWVFEYAKIRESGTPILLDVYLTKKDEVTNERERVELSNALKELKTFDKNEQFEKLKQRAWNAGVPEVSSADELEELIPTLEGNAAGLAKKLLAAWRDADASAKKELHQELGVTKRQKGKELNITVNTFDPEKGEYVEAETVAITEADGTQHKVMVSARQGREESEVTEFRPYRREHKSEVEELFGEETRRPGMPSIGDPGGPLRPETTKLRNYICEAFLPGSSGERVRLMTVEAPSAKKALERAMKSSAVEQRLISLVVGNRENMISNRLENIADMKPRDQYKAIRDITNIVQMQSVSGRIKAPNDAKAIEFCTSEIVADEKQKKVLDELIGKLQEKIDLLEGSTDIPEGISDDRGGKSTDRSELTLTRAALEHALELKKEMERNSEKKQVGYSSVLHNVLGQRETIVALIKQTQKYLSYIDDMQENARARNDHKRVEELDIERDVYDKRLSLLKEALRNPEKRKELETEQSMIAPKRPIIPTKRRYTPGEEEYDVPPEEEEGKEISVDQQKYLNLMIEKAKAQAELASYERRVHDKGTQGIIDNRLKDEINSLEQKIADFDQRLNKLSSNFGGLDSDKKFTRLSNQRVYLELMRAKTDYERQLAKRQAELNSIEGKGILDEEAEENIRKVIEKIEANIAGIDEQLKDPDLKKLRRSKKFMSFVEQDMKYPAYMREKRALQRTLQNNNSGKDVTTRIESWYNNLPELEKSQYEPTIAGVEKRLAFLKEELEKMKDLPARQERFDKGYPISEMPIAREMRGERELLEDELTPTSEYSEKISDIERQMNRSVPQELSETEEKLEKMKRDIINTGFFASQEIAHQRPEEKASERKKRQETAPMRRTKVRQLNEHVADEAALNLDAQVRRLQEKLTGLGLDISSRSAMMKGIEADYPERVAELMKDWENMNEYRGMRNKFRDYVRLVKHRDNLVAEQKGLETERSSKQLEEEVKTIIGGVKKTMGQMGKKSREEAETIPSEFDNVETMKEVAVKVAGILNKWMSAARTNHEKEAFSNRIKKINDWISNL